MVRGTIICNGFQHVQHAVNTLEAQPGAELALTTFLKNPQVGIQKSFKSLPHTEALPISTFSNPELVCTPFIMYLAHYHRETFFRPGPVLLLTCQRLDNFKYSKTGYLRKKGSGAGEIMRILMHGKSEKKRGSFSPGQSAFMSDPMLAPRHFPALLETLPVSERYTGHRQNPNR